MAGVISFFTTLILGLLPIRLSDISYYFKWILSYVSVRLQKHLNKGRLDFYTPRPRGHPDRSGFLPHDNEKRMESPQSEAHLQQAEDGIFFYGVDSKGDCLIVSVARQCNYKAEAQVHLRLASGRLFELVKKSDFQQSTANEDAFTCGGLMLYHIRPMKTWRIFYSGYLKETSAKSSSFQRMTYVKFSMIWRASSDVYDSTTDLNDASLINSLSKEDWGTFVPPTHKLSSTIDFYAQAGIIMGNVFLEDGEEDHELYLFGERTRFLGELQLNKEINFSHVLGFVHENGMLVHFGQASVANVVKNINYGFVIKPSGSLKKLKNLEVSVTEDSSVGHQNITATIWADHDYTFSGSVIQPNVWICNKDKSVTISEMVCYVDGIRGNGVYITGKYMLSTEKESVIQSPVTIPEYSHPVVVAFTEDLCELPELTGGKGSSLGKLTSLSREIQSFRVPSGVVVTTSAYKRFVDDNILQEIKSLEDVLYGNKEGDPKEACKRVCEKIMETKIPVIVIESIVKSLKKIYGDAYISTKFAIRSSATGEDTEQMSAAGQMETFLGITGRDNILTAVKQCWASQFGFVAIQYKRRYGQCLNSPMAVVIQEMVACDTAGVIFTCDPVTGNATKMSISANFGLGESVVSASVDPDNIELARDAEDELKIHKITAGKKSQRIVMTDEGTTFEDNAENERDRCCLSTEDIFRLGNLAIKIEKCYRSKRDIEWGIKNGNVYLLQSRPVTSGTQETDFEIEHEFDAALRVENDYTSVANAAEIHPGAMSALGRDIFLKEFKVVWQTQPNSGFSNGVYARYFEHSWYTMSQHLMFNVIDHFRGAKPHERSDAERAFMVAFFGRILDNEEIFQVAYNKFSDETFPSPNKYFSIFKSLMFPRQLRYAQKYYANYEIPVHKYDTSQEMFNAMIADCGNVETAMLTHLICSSASSLWNMSILGILSSSNTEINNEMFTDFAKLITVKGNVESADVPAAIEDLAFHIQRSIKVENVKSMTAEEALQWLRKTPSVSKKFSDFITKHGHRGVNEIDVYSNTWGTDLKSLVRLLQNLVGNVSHEATKNSNLSVWKQISGLKTKLGLFSKLKLLLLVPLSRKGVHGREGSKSMMVKGVDIWRQAVLKLARRMVAEGRIPEERILYFMTLDEIKELLETRSPKVLAKAYHRLRLHPKLDEYKFPEIMRGPPRPINENENAILSENGDAFMQGLPVSQGIAKGYVRKAINLDEAAHLKPGEILLAYGTDIGWTPYFPKLGGVATELGGLISHGAVVSREYGLPCVAALHGATKIFQTGDYVLLDGNKGIIQKIQPPAE